MTIPLRVDFDQGSAIVKKRDTITYFNVRDRDRFRQGKKIRGRIRHGHNVRIQPGVGVRLFGIRYSYASGKLVPVRYKVDFKVGDLAEYDRIRDRPFIGLITKVTKGLITIEPLIEDRSIQRRRRLSPYEFSWRNEDYGVSTSSRRRP